MSNQLPWPGSATTKNMCWVVPPLHWFEKAAFLQNCTPTAEGVFIVVEKNGWKKARVVHGSGHTSRVRSGRVGSGKGWSDPIRSVRGWKSLDPTRLDPTREISTTSWPDMKSPAKDPSATIQGVHRLFFFFLSEVAQAYQPLLTLKKKKKKRAATRWNTRMPLSTSRYTTNKTALQKKKGVYGEFGWIGFLAVCPLQSQSQPTKKMFAVGKSGPKCHF